MRNLMSTRSNLTLVLSALFLALTCLHCTAQSSNGNDHTALTYSWEIDQQTGKHEPVLVLKNSGSGGIKMSGLSLYFNSIKKPILGAGHQQQLQMSQVNGDLFKIRSKPGLTEIAGNGSLRISLTVPEIRNYTELPSGFYLVYDREPGKGHPLKNTSKAIPGIEPAVALTSYKNNEQLNTLPLSAPSIVFPTPVSIKMLQGSFTVNQDTRIVSDPTFTKEAQLLADELGVLLGKKPGIVTQKTTNPAIVLQRGESPEGGYLLSSGPQGITITANEGSGIFYGIQSLKTMLPAESWAAKRKQLIVPAVEVSDAPRFGHRAFLLDIARNFQSKDEVYKIIDLMALYKMNVLHLHLNDDEGWRIEIDGLPELTSIGSRRGHSIANDMLPPSYGSGPGTDNPFGTGYFSRKEYIALLKYAAARYVDIIPEIETPGHARAAIKSMDARYDYYMKKGKKQEAEEFLLRDRADSSVYRSVQGWNDNVINPALPSTYQFIRKVTGELVRMYAEAGAPLKTIHMGGDEVPEGVWAKSPAVLQLLEKEPSIGSVYGMWKYYFSKVNDILKTQHLYLSGWEEIGLKKTLVNGKGKWITDPTVSGRGYTTDVWNNIIGTGAEDLAYKLANGGFKVVLSNVTNNYLDMAYNNSFYEHGMNWAGFVNVDKPFYFIPYNYYLTTTENEYGEPVAQSFFRNKDQLKAESKNNIIGLQSALWSETLVAEGLLEYMVLPKLLGSAERSWAKDPAWSGTQGAIFSSQEYKQAWSTFTSTIGLRELPRLDHYKAGFLYRIPEPGVQQRDGKVYANVQLPGFEIRYTTNGAEPDVQSKVYTTPVSEKGTITLKVFNHVGRSGKSVTVQNN
ncbi:N-acetyl-beta-hexosaminidase [Pedobacter sp. BAL39]|uniref:family 20 glycosylhydrolase n=1 Tax=Pedobacter sp. BAL39 TaxID=391596 RepID=UPI000155A90F|nr:family 20 glycosylhydrolase [Pedobacter sp. BAL39]EDM34406.1 N-acetyl-beta-hexosaminidase [Pedobacter sp. BAL39]